MAHQSMRCAVISGPQQIQIEDRSVPDPEENEALIRVDFVALCGTDQALFWDASEARRKPVVFGHEFSGRVVSVQNGNDLIAGQPVTVAPLFNCGDCDFCRSGQENMCPKRRRFGVAVDGALQEYVCVSADRVFQLPDKTSLEEGALIEPLAVAYHTVRRSGPPIGEGALVLGAGAIGLLIAQVWRALGYGSVSVIDINPQRLAVAEELGIPVWKQAPEVSSFHTIFEATGSAQAFSHWLPSLAPRGKVVVVSKLENPVTIDWVSLLRKEGEIVTSRYFTLADFEGALDLVERGMIQLKPFIGAVVPFQMLSENYGLDVMSLAKDTVRLVVRF